MAYISDVKEFSIVLSDILKLIKDDNNFDTSKPIEIFRKNIKNYKKAQKHILSEHIKYNEEHKRLSLELKNKPSHKKKNTIKKLISEVEYKISLLRNLLYSIVWELFNGKKEILSRFHIKPSGRNQLSGKGFNAINSLCNELNTDPDKFALICDLTDNLHIGDLLVFNPYSVGIIEVKSGKKNEEAIRIIDFYKKNQIDLEELKTSKSFSPSFLKQINRILRQEEDATKVLKIVNTDKGDEPNTGHNVELLDSYITDITYHYEILDLINGINSKNWNYNNLLGIINIGAYQQNAQVFGKHALQISNNNFPVYNLMSSLGKISETVFNKPFPIDTIIDIALGNVIIYIGVEIDELINLSNAFGKPMRWSTRKEFEDFSKDIIHRRNEIYSYNNKGLITQDEKYPNIIAFQGMGFLAKIVYDNIIPHTLLYNRRFDLEIFHHKINK